MPTLEQRRLRREIDAQALLAAHCEARRDVAELTTSLDAAQRRQLVENYRRAAQAAGEDAERLAAQYREKFGAPGRAERGLRRLLSILGLARGAR